MFLFVKIHNSHLEHVLQVGICAFAIVFVNIHNSDLEHVVQVGICVFTGETAQDSFAFKGLAEK